MAITLTDAAATRVKKYLTNSEAVGLRLGVRNAGCSGYAYVVDLTNSIESQDHVFESNDVKVVVDPKSLPFVDGTEIDFSGDQMSASFKFRNPNEKGQCGCGESFST